MTIENNSQGFFYKVYEIVKRIPKGKVATYGQVAALAGNKRASRAVGYALHANPSQSTIPCHRVVNKTGGLAKGFAFGGTEIQAMLLEDEGVECLNGSVADLEAFIWKPQNN